VNHTSFPPPYGTWYSRWAAIYNEVPAVHAAATNVAAVAPIHTLPKLTEAA
jgi:hypothetical protein